MKTNYKLLVLFALVLLNVQITFPQLLPWVQTNLPNNLGSVNCITVSGVNILASTDKGLFRSSNNGDNWTQVMSSIAGNLITALAAVGKNLYAGTNGSGVFCSTDNGTTWVGLGSSAMFSSVRVTSFVFTVKSISLHGQKPIIYNVFASTSTRNDIPLPGLLFFDGTTWIPVNSDLDLANTEVYAVIASGKYFFAGTDKGVYRSANNGINWTKVSNNLPNTGIFSLAASGTKIYAGTKSGAVYCSTNKGVNWTRFGIMTYIGYGLPAFYVTSLAVTTNNVFAGTSNSIIWRKPYLFPGPL
jgi:photosystem II stability/assembly factor-like uncharacterized protein